MIDLSVERDCRLERASGIHAGKRVSDVASEFWCGSEQRSSCVGLGSHIGTCGSEVCLLRIEQITERRRVLQVQNDDL